MGDREAIHAVHVDDQKDLLIRLGLLDSFQTGDLKCRNCEQPVRERGLGLVRMNDVGEIEVACAEATCDRTRQTSA